MRSEDNILRQNLEEKWQVVTACHSLVCTNQCVLLCIARVEESALCCLRLKEPRSVSKMVKKTERDFRQKLKVSKS